MAKEIKKKIKDHIRHILCYKDSLQLKNKNFTIISNNCWGGNVCRDFNIKHQSPFVGLFIYSPEYIKLVKNLEYYMRQELIFVETSKHEGINETRKTQYFPIGLIGDVELQMNHYKSEEEAREKWNRRKKRINWENLYFKINENFDCTTEILEEFDKLPYKNKIIFSRNDYKTLENGVFLKKFDLKNEMYLYRKYFDIVKWLNTGEIVRKSITFK